MPSFLSIKSTLFLWVILAMNCADTTSRESTRTATQRPSQAEILLGANRMEKYLPLLAGKSVGIVANQTSVVQNTTASGSRFTHLVDTLLARGIMIQKVFAPEHGFRGTADAGEKVKDGVDQTTGLPIISLYGKNRKPTREQLSDLDILVFDIQDVGVRFYTYIATLQYVMESCSESGIPLIVLDRPNPNGHYVDGPTMELEYRSFLGLNAIPLVYGMTIGEYARMINEEAWLEGSVRADLSIIPLKNYSHDRRYELPVRPSPNLPNAKAVNLYPSLGLFEGTHINAGRGTEFQFQRYGSPYLDPRQFPLKYVPQPNFGSKSPKFNDEVCYGEDLSDMEFLREVRLDWIIKAYKNTPDKSEFFNTSGFTKHAGTQALQEQIEAGWSAGRIKDSWQADLEAFKKIRKKYLLYP